MGSDQQQTDTVPSIEEGMTWHQAYQWLSAKDGKEVRRKSWSEPDVTQWGYFGIARHKGAGESYYHMTLYAGTLQCDICNDNWHPNKEEQDATDWETTSF